MKYEDDSIDHSSKEAGVSLKLKSQLVNASEKEGFKNVIVIEESSPPGGSPETSQHKPGQMQAKLGLSLIPIEPSGRFSERSSSKGSAKLLVVPEDVDDAPSSGSREKSQAPMENMPASFAARIAMIN